MTCEEFMDILTEITKRTKGNIRDTTRAERSAMTNHLNDCRPCVAKLARMFWESMARDPIATMICIDRGRQVRASDNQRSDPEAPLT